MVKKINNQEEFHKTISKGLWLVDFSAKWCGPCRMLEPVIESISGNYDVVKVDIDEADELTSEYGIMSVPTLLVFEDGKLKTKEVGYMSEEEILELFK